MSSVTLRGVVKEFDGLRVLDGIDLDVPSGSAVTLIGASGSGKSTLLRCVNLLEPIDDGYIALDGSRHQRAGARSRTRSAGASGWCSRASTCSLTCA